MSGEGKRTWRPRPEGPAEPRAAPEQAPPGWRNDLGGTVHGPAIQAHSIGDVHLTVGSTAAVPVPRQLPPPPPHFTGRTEELAELNRLAGGSGQAGGIAIVVIVASGGTGKTALASHWLHAISDRYEGGALFADLRGHDLAEATDPGDVAAGFLRVLGVPPERIPLGAAEQSALFRSVTSGRRMLILLDNAASAAQVRLLLPGPGSVPEPESRPGPGPGTQAGTPQPEAAPGTFQSARPSLVVVTTRWRMAGLAIDGARFLELGPLEEPAALNLIDRMIGEDRAAAEPAARHALVRLADGLPLALSVCAARLAAHPRWPLRRLAAELADEQSRLRAMSLTGDLSVRAAFDTSYRALEPDAQRAYRMTALIPGPDFNSDLAAATLDIDEERLTPLLETLADACLLTEADSDRYRFHDLARLHAREHADSEPEADRKATLARAVTWYLSRAVAADQVVSPLRWHLNQMYEQVALMPPAHESSANALEWLEARLPGLLAAIQAAYDAALYQHAWQLCEAMWGVFLFRKHFRAWISSHTTGLAAAQACADLRAEARMRVQLGTALRHLGRSDEARQHFIAALSLARQANQPIGEATALEQIALIDMSQQRPDAAIAGFAEAQAIHKRIGVARGVAVTTRHIGEAHREAGRYDRAIRGLSEARDLFAALPDPYMEARTLTSLGQTYLLADRPRDAVQPLIDALATMARLGSHYEQARIDRYLGATAAQLGDRSSARDHLSGALARFEETGAPEADQVRRELAALEAASDTDTDTSGPAEAPSCS
ncbi:MAG: ATP-binding protein [Nocardiopsaceae bacterium]|nr:ATP-binding protein [Nocardiopsaceae bacterium]